jgi:hypothetical protein
VLDRPAESIIEYSTSAPPFFVPTGSAADAVPVALCALGVISRILATDTFAHFAQPDACPGEFYSEYRETDRDNDEPWPGCHQHDHTEHDNGGSDREHRYATRRLVSEMYDFLDHDDSGLRQRTRAYHLSITYNSTVLSH